MLTCNDDGCRSFSGFLFLFVFLQLLRLFVRLEDQLVVDLLLLKVHHKAIVLGRRDCQHFSSGSLRLRN